MQTIRLNGYTAAASVPLLRLGTRDSFGIERLQIVPGAEWDGLALTATFVTPAGSTRMVVAEDGTVEVPAAATAAALTPAAPGRIVFAGTGAGVQRITADLPYLVTDHAPVTGDAPAPQPSEWEQYVTRMQQALDAAVPPDGSAGQVLTKTPDGNVWAYPSGGGGGTGGGYIIGAGLRLDPGSNVLSVDTADAVEADNTRPVTSAAVYTTVGNIDALLTTI